MSIYKLDKVAVSMKNNAVEFLNGLASNSMDKPWNALTDIHGRVIAVFDQAMISEEEIWIVLDKPAVDSVLAHLDRYARLSGVKVEKKENLNVYFDTDGKMATETGDIVIAQKKGSLVVTPKPVKSNMSAEEFTAFRVKNSIPQQGVDFLQGE